MQGQSIELYNDGNMKRSFTYISDITDAIAALIEKKNEGKDLLYNLGGAEAVPLTDFVELIEKELGKKSEKQMLPLQPGDVPETLADCSLAKKDFGYEPKVSIVEGIKRFTAWLRENEDFALSLSEPKQ
jgi:UDP-glucuronate 4-epimerase